MRFRVLSLCTQTLLLCPAELSALLPSQQAHACIQHSPPLPRTGEGSLYSKCPLCVVKCLAVLGRGCDHLRCQTAVAPRHAALPLFSLVTRTGSPTSVGTLRFFAALSQVTKPFPASDSAFGTSGKSFFTQLVGRFAVSIAAFCFFTSEERSAPRKLLISDGKANPLM